MGDIAADSDYEQLTSFVFDCFLFCCRAGC